MASSIHPATDVRRLWPADMPLFRDHLLRLDSRSRHERFGGGMSDDFLVRYAKSCFGEGDRTSGEGRGKWHGKPVLRHSLGGDSPARRRSLRRDPGEILIRRRSFLRISILGSG